jgi:hypothetical protein
MCAMGKTLGGQANTAQKSRQPARYEDAKEGGAEQRYGNHRPHRVLDSLHVGCEF